MKIEKLPVYLSYALVLLSIGLLKLQSRYLENVIEGKSFALYAILIGISLAFGYGRYMYKTNKERMNSDEAYAKMIFVRAISITILTIFGITYFNYYTGNDSAIWETVYLENKSTNAMYGTTYVTLIMDGRSERFNPTHAEYRLLPEKDSIRIQVGKGKMGYRFIVQFQPVRPSVSAPAGN